MSIYSLFVSCLNFKNMRKLSTKIPMLLCLLVSANLVFSQTPIEFNNKLASVNDSLFIKGQEWGKKFKEVRAAKEYSQLAPFRIDLESYISRKVVEVKQMKDVAGSKEFREGMIDFLLFEKQMMKEGFIPVEKLNSSSTDEQVKVAIDNLIKLSKDETAKLEAFRKVQAAYAESNGFKIAGQ